MGEALADDEIVLRVPASTDYAGVVRVGAAAVALRQGMSFTEIDELRAAMNEAAELLLMPPAENDQPATDTPAETTPTELLLMPPAENDQPATDTPAETTPTELLLMPPAENDQPATDTPAETTPTELLLMPPAENDQPATDTPAETTPTELLLMPPTEDDAALECVFRVHGGCLEVEVRRTDESAIAVAAADRFKEAADAANVTVTVQCDRGRLLMRKPIGQPGA